MYYSNLQQKHKSIVCPQTFYFFEEANVFAQSPRHTKTTVKVETFNQPFKKHNINVTLGLNTKCYNISDQIYNT